MTPDLHPQTLQHLQRALESTLEGTGLHGRVLLFGSRVQGRSTPQSDIDLALDFEPIADAKTLNRLREAFDVLPILQSVDVVNLLSLNEAFQRSIREHHWVIYEC